MKKQKNELIIALSGVLILLISFIAFNNFGETKEVNIDNKKTATKELGCNYDSLTGAIDYSQETGVFEGNEVRVPKYALSDSTDTRVLGLASEERWIEVDLSDQKLYAWEGDDLYMESLISSGLPWFPTPTGEFRVWIKLRATRMEGGSGAYYYNLPNVPHTMYFENDEIPGWRGFGIHGAYWHNEFGTQRSHGCVNLPLDAAEKLYYWATPILPDGKGSIRSTPENPGIRVVIHE